MIQRVHVMTPTRGTSVRPEHAMFREWLMVHEARAGRFDLYGRYVEGYPTNCTRSKIVNAFLADEAAQWLFMLDDDNVPTCNPLDYIEQDPDVLGFVFPTIRVNDADPIRWFPIPPEDETRPVLAEVVGGGCFLIARRVLEHPQMRPAFFNTYHPDGTLDQPEDVNFCRKVWAAGFQVRCILNKPLLHWKIGEVVGLWKRGGQGESQNGG